MKNWIAGIGMAALAALAVSPAGAQDARDRGNREEPRLITVSGQAEIRLKPDLITLSIGVEERGEDVAGPRTRAAAKAQDIIRALTARGVKQSEIQTSRFSVNRQWEQEPNVAADRDGRMRGKWVIVVANTVTVRTEQIDKAGDLLDAAVAAGSNNINGPFFGLKDDENAKRDALAAAVANARAKADVVAKASGVTIVGLQSLSEGASYSPRPMMRMEAFAGDMGSAPSTPIESGEVVVSSNVTAAFRF